MSGYQSSNMAAGEVWLQWFSCCINQPAQQRKRQQRRRGQVRIDRSMIGEPTNFQHTGHIGSGDVELGNSRLRAIQNQMQSKGGYETAFTTVKMKNCLQDEYCRWCPPHNQENLHYRDVQQQSQYY